MKHTPAKLIALGGILAALAVSLMFLGTLIPVATFACPVLCMVILQLVLRLCGPRIGWAWYGAVAILSLLTAPDKEAAAIFLCLGYYPLVKPKLDQMKFGIILKLLLFNGVVVLMYWGLIHLLGMADIAEDYRGMGIAMTAVLLILGNVTFLLLDKVLERFRFKK